MNYNNIDIIDLIETGLLLFTAFCTIIIIIIMNMMVVFN